MISKLKGQINDISNISIPKLRESKHDRGDDKDESGKGDQSKDNINKKPSGRRGGADAKKDENKKKDDRGGVRVTTHIREEE